jgi:hypothetical protein
MRPKNQSEKHCSRLSRRRPGCPLRGTEGSQEATAAGLLAGISAITEIEKAASALAGGTVGMNGDGGELALALFDTLGSTSAYSS